MASVHSISIHNFRGVKQLEHTFDSNNLVVLIGRCDSGKSTILKAISLVLCPYWNPSISASDFYNEDISAPIEIEVTLRDVPEELLSDKKFGLYYRILKDGIITDDIVNSEDGISLLTIKFVVDSELEPKWYVTNARNGSEDIEIRQSDRAKLKAFYISDYIDSHFTLSKGSPLYTLLSKSLTEGISVSQKLLNVTRDANSKVREQNNFEEFDSTLSSIKTVASTLGLHLDDLKALLELKENVYSQSSITLHDGDIPFHLHGKGAKRLLSIAIQLNLIEDGGIILIDEIEQGLEPDRVVNIVKLLKESTKGQVFLTTHSSEALCEVNYDNVHILHPSHDSIGVCNEDMVQLLRKAPYSFFAKRLVCCEGRTEYAIIRSIGEHIRKVKGHSLASLGICPVDCGGGTKHLDWPLKFKSLGYDVCVFSDSDESSKYKDRLQTLKEENIPLFAWEDGFCTEMQMMKDLPWSGIVNLLNYKLESNGMQPFNIDGIRYAEDTAPDSFSIEDQDKMRAFISAESKRNNRGTKNTWFKDIPGGEILGHVWMESLSKLKEDSSLNQVYNQLEKWMLEYV